MSDGKMNSVNSDCPSFYKEKVKKSHKGSKKTNIFKRFLESLIGQK